MAVLGNKIKDANEIQSSIKRIAYQVYESNFDERNIVIVGIGSRGESLSKLLGAAIEKISPLKSHYVTLTIDKKNPLNRIESDVPIEELKNQSLVVVDDVLNTGSTLIYAVAYF